MGKPGSRSATHALTHTDLVLASARGPRGALVVVALLLAALALGALGSYAWWRAQPAIEPGGLQTLMAQQHVLQQQLDQARLALRMSQGKAEALERGIDALNKQLGECQEQLTFYRKAREPQPH